MGRIDLRTRRRRGTRGIRRASWQKGFIRKRKSSAIRTGINERTRLNSHDPRCLTTDLCNVQQYQPRRLRTDRRVFACTFFAKTFAVRICSTIYVHARHRSAYSSPDLVYPTLPPMSRVCVFACTSSRMIYYARPPTTRVRVIITRRCDCNIIICTGRPEITFLCNERQYVRL